MHGRQPDVVGEEIESRKDDEAHDMVVVPHVLVY